MVDEKLDKRLRVAAMGLPSLLNLIEDAGREIARLRAELKLCEQEHEERQWQPGWITQGFTCDVCTHEWVGVFPEGLDAPSPATTCSACGKDMLHHAHG